jgi:hypothetical protein
VQYVKRFAEGPCRSNHHFLHCYWNIAAGFAKPPHQGVVGATVPGWIVAQGPVGVPQGLDPRKLAGMVHHHAPESGYGSLDLPPMGFVVLAIVRR